MGEHKHVVLPLENDLPQSPGDRRKTGALIRGPRQLSAARWAAGKVWAVTADGSLCSYDAELGKQASTPACPLSILHARPFACQRASASLVSAAHHRPPCHP